MKWFEKTKKQPLNGDKRIITKFLWFPLTISKETRWLEVASIQQHWSGPHWIGNDYTSGCNCWFDDKFTN
jgi:hypothetical protein